MADIQKTIEIIFGATDTNVSSITGNISSSFSQLDGAVQGVAGPISDVTTSLLKTEAAIIATGAAVTALSVSMAGDFATSIAEVGTLMNQNAEQNTALAQTLIDYSRDASVGLDDIVQASYIAISTGTELADITTALAAAEQLAVAGATNLATATGALSRTMNAYGFEASESERVSNALFIAVQNGDTTMDALAGSIGRVATIAATSNVPVETLLAAIAGITVAGINTNQTITGLAALFKEFAKPTDELAAALNGMSLETHTLDEIMVHLQGVTGGSLEGFTNLFSSIEAVKVATALANDATGTFASTLIAMEKETDNLAQAYSIMETSIARLNQNLVNNIKATLIEAGIPLLDEYGSAIQAMSAIFKGLGDGVEAPNLEPVYGALESFVTEFTLLLDGMASALPDALADLDFSGLIAAFSTLKGEVGEVFDALFGEGLDLTKPEDLAEALQKVVNAITAMTQITAAVINEFEPIFTTIGEAINQISGLDDKTLETAGKIGAIAIELDKFGTIAGATLAIIKETNANVSDTLNILIGGFSIFLNTINIAFNEFIILMGGSVESLLNIGSSLPTFLGGDIFKAEAAEFGKIVADARDDMEVDFADMEAAVARFESGMRGDAAAAATSIEKIGTVTADVAPKIEALNSTTGASFADMATSAEAAGLSVGEYIVELASLALNAQDGAEAVSKLNTSIDSSSSSFQQLEDDTDKADGTLDGFVKTMENGVAVYTQTTTGLVNVNTSLANTSTEAEKAEEKADDFLVKMEEIASAERVKNTEFFINLEIANVEATSRQVVAAFESISSTVDSLAAGVTDLWTLIAGGDTDSLTKWKLEDAAKRAEERLDENLEQQEKLIAAQIKLMDAQAQALTSDKAPIEINADNLSPELQAVLKALIDNIRIEAINNGLELLL